MKELIEIMSHFEHPLTLYFPYISITYEWNKSPLFSMTYGLTWRARCPIIEVVNERTILGKTYMKYYFYVASFLLIVFMVSI